MAKFRVAAVFSSNMVLQREKNVTIFGHGENNRKICVRLMDQEYTSVVKDEKWSVLLPPMDAGTGYEMSVTCGTEEYKFYNIAIGEVWLAGGQSNMEFELQNSSGGTQMLQNDKNPNVRYYYTPKNAYMDDKFFVQEEASGWSEFSADSAKNWSAAGHIFAKKLAAELGVTVGIIGCNWGGTSASCWMNEESLREDRELQSYLEEYETAIQGKTIETQISEYQEYESYHADWEKRSAEQYKLNPELSWGEVQEICGVCRWPGPKGCLNPFRPSGLYHCMLERVMPYTLRGFIYYQGESDDHKPTLYQKLLTRMIRQWREDWGDITLPFIMVQLPMHRYKQDPDWKNWCLIREAQMNTYQTVKNTGIAVLLDCGEFNEIHPKDKKPVGERLALQALSLVYHRIKETDAFGPVYQSYCVRDDKLELSFSYAEEGFVVKGEASGFELAGDDMSFVPADITIQGSRILLTSPEVKHPSAARYCWTNYGEVTIFGQNGLPLAPFRTYR